MLRSFPMVICPEPLEKLCSELEFRQYMSAVHQIQNFYRDAGNSLTRPEKKQTTATSL
jgi:hypothetical protein